MQSLQIWCIKLSNRFINVFTMRKAIDIKAIRSRRPIRGVYTNEFVKPRIHRSFAGLKKNVATPSCRSFGTWVLENSSVHGFAHLTKRNRHPIELILWVIFVILGFCGAIYLSLMMWVRYSNSPSVISVNIRYRDRNASFPAITMCPETYLDVPYIKQVSNNDTKLMSFLEALQNVNYKNLDKIVDYYPEYDSKDYLSYIAKYSVNLSMTLQGNEVNKITMVKSLTETGICFTYYSTIAVYNSIDYWQQNKWNIAPKNKEKKLPQIHPFMTQCKLGMVQIKPELDYWGFIHSPFETMDGVKPTHLEKSYFNTFFIRFLEIASSPSLESLSVQQRHCRFHYESNLAHSSVYSYQLCVLECRIQLILKACNCVPFFYRHIEGEKVCSLRDMGTCLVTIKNQLISLRYPNNTRICSCEPNCNDGFYWINGERPMSLVDYQYTMTSIDWIIQNFPKQQYKRSVLFTFNDLLVSIGGMFGLFLGASILCFVELTYFLTLRLFCFIVFRREII